MNDQLDSLSFEEALAELERIVEQLEAGDLTLEESLSLFERGQRLGNRCHDQLEAAALRVEQLTDEGEIVEVEVS
ncbi:MAG: exodeoxyribonuclease VII small subunit [Candidatus Promineifilaceae bacterium]|nr:exodeoxyribonuclease VII small subunit [Candidatus Promineifilaceae bacterium]